MQISEEEAIEQVKRLLENANPFTMPPYIYFSLEKVVNLIKKQQKEIENSYWKGYIDKQNESMEICKQCKYIKNNKIKDKMIDDMAEFIDTRLDNCLLNYLNIDEACENYSEPNRKTCKDCIKEYFRKKVME